MIFYIYVDKDNMLDVQTGLYIHATFMQFSFCKTISLSMRPRYTILCEGERGGLLFLLAAGLADRGGE
jgi:hypothetical protein